MAFLSLTIASVAPAHDKKEVLSLQPDPHFFVLQTQSGSAIARLRKRPAYPVTYCRALLDGAWELGYGKDDGQIDSEFLRIVISGNGTLQIERDAYATLPLFYAVSAGRLTVSNEYEDVVAAIPDRQLSRAAILESLAITVHPARPYVHGVGVLYEREKLTYDTINGMRVTRPPDRWWRKSADVPAVDPARFVAELDTYFDRFISTRLAGQSFAFEVSGGLDSATLPQYYARTYESKAPIATVLFPGKYEITQRQKLEPLTRNAGSAFFATALDLETMYPLARMAMADRSTPHYYENIYYEATADLLSQLQAQGIEVISTGVGGDELFGNTVDPAILVAHSEPERQRRLAQPLPSFVTSVFRDEYVKSAPNSPPRALPLHALSVASGSLGNNLYIRHDIWPVSPFMDVDFYAWCQGLPAYFRANKNILRSYHQAYGFIADVYHPVLNEDFADFFAEAFRHGKHDTLFNRLIDGSVTARLGYVDTEKVIVAYEKARDERVDEELFSLYLWLSTEINLQHM